MYKLSPSLLAADFYNLGGEIDKLKGANISMLHLDVMDGVFVPNISFGFPVLRALRPRYDYIFDLHLMIDRPERYVEHFIKEGADWVTISYESTTRHDQIARTIHGHGKRYGVALKPETPASVLASLKVKPDLVLVMCVEPGFGGQTYLHDCQDKITQVRAMLGPQVDISVDGGIDPTTILGAKQAGANIFVAGTSIFRTPDPAKAAAELDRLLQK